MKKNIEISKPNVEREKNLFEDFTTLRWVKWTTRQPDWNGSVYVRWNGKYTSLAIVHQGFLMSLDDGINNDGRTKYTASKKTGKISIKYTKNQKRLLEDMYWLEEKHDFDGMHKYVDSQISEEFK